MSALNILRNGIVQAEIAIDERTELVHKLLGEHKIAVQTIAQSPLNLQIGDYIEHNNERYYLNQSPNVEKINNITYSYTMDFEGEIYYLYNKVFMDEGQTDFSYSGDPNDFLLLLLENINSILPGWSIAQAEAAPLQTISFIDDTCRTALTKIAEAFGMEYRLAGKAIYLQKSVGANTTLEFEYGRGKGLYTISRSSVEDKGLLTRVFGFGARKNIGIDYRDGASRLVFEERLLENNIDLYGIREGSVTFDDIYPQRTGTVTAIDGADIFRFTDANLDFNINDYLLEGTVAKVVFKTGALTGYEFELKRYLNDSKTLIILPFVEENDYELPNDLNFAAIGDEYTLVDIKMPQSYIDAAEANLKAATQEYIDENSAPRVAYAIDIDEKFIKANGIALKVADLVRVIDADLGVDTQIRISELSYPLVNSFKVSAIFSDSILYTTQERLIADTVDNTILTRNVDRRRAELARRSAARMRQLQDLVFDPDDYFNPERIKPLSIETLMLSVGAKSQNFGLLGVTLQPNAGGNTANFNISGGQLVHYEISIEGLGYVWNVAPNNFSGLDPVKPYYVYAKCSKTSLTGIWELSELPRGSEDEAGQYLFNLGILYPVADDRRDFDFTSGMTFISGDTITTGTIRSLDGLNFFDLAGGRFKIGNNTSSLDWNVTTPNKLTLRGSLLQTAAGDPVVIPNSRGAYDNAANYFEGDVVTYNGNSYINTTPSATLGVIPTNSSHWEPFVEGGQAGQDGADGQDGEDGQDGAQGAQGPQGVQGPIGPTGPSGNAGPAIVFRGIFAQGVYYNNTKRRDVVLLDGTYYLFNGTNASTQSSFVASRWENFGAQFNSVATDLLLAESANIADWIINNGQIVSQSQYGSEPKVRLDGEDGVMTFKGSSRVFSPTGSASSLVDAEATIEDNKLRITRASGQSQNFSEVVIAPDRVSISGVKMSGGGDVYTGRWLGIEADVACNVSAAIAGAYIAAIYGKVNNSGNTESFGGYFERLKAIGLNFEGPLIEKIRRVNTGFTITANSTDYHIIHTGNNDITITMPSQRDVGRTFIIKRSNSGDVFLNGNGVNFYRNAVQSGTGSLFIPVVGMAFRITWDGTYWQYYQMWA